MADPKLADTIKLVRRPGGFSLQIDGEEFPWLVAGDGVALTVRPDATPAVTVTILASRVEVVDSLDEP